MTTSASSQAYGYHWRSCHDGFFRAIVNFFAKHFNIVKSKWGKCLNQCSYSGCVLNVLNNSWPHHIRKSAIFSSMRWHWHPFCILWLKISDNYFFQSSLNHWYVCHKGLIAVELHKLIDNTGKIRHWQRVTAVTSHSSDSVSEYWTQPTASTSYSNLSLKNVRFISYSSHLQADCIYPVQI